MTQTNPKIDGRIWLVLTVLVLIWSGIGPKDRFTWFLEVAPVLIALPILILSRRAFR
jgi:putative membrane protein